MLKPSCRTRIVPGWRAVFGGGKSFLHGLDPERTYEPIGHLSRNRVDTV